MQNKLIFAIRKAAAQTQTPPKTQTPTQMSGNNQKAFFDGLRSTLRIPNGTTQGQWNAGRVGSNTAARTPGTTSIDPAIVNQHTTTVENDAATPAYAANRINAQAVWSGHGRGARQWQAKIMGKLLGRMRNMNHNVGGSANVKPGEYGALSKQQLSAARAWYGLGAGMSDEQVQKRVQAQAKLLAKNKAPQRGTSAYGRGITNYGNNAMPA